MMSRNRNSFHSAAFRLIIVTVLVKLAGFLKQSVVSFSFGASQEMDTFYIVTGFINDLGSMFFASAAITIVALYHEQKNREDLHIFLSNTFIAMTVLSLLMAAAFHIMAGSVAQFLAPGYDVQMLSVITLKIRVMSIICININISNLCIAILNAEKRFVQAKSIGVIQSACMIFGCIAVRRFMGINALYLSLFAYYILENVYLLYNIRKYVRFRPCRAFTDIRIRTLFRLGVPLFISNALIQLNALIDKAIASGMETGSVSALSYGHFLFSTLHSILIGSVSTVLLSYNSEDAARWQEDKIVEKTRNSLKALMVVMIPITIVCCLNSAEIVRLVYAHGSFDENAVRLTSDAFQGYSVGLCFLTARDVLLQIPYAYKETKKVMICGFFGMTVNTLLSYLLSKHFGTLGIAAADSIAYGLLAAGSLWLSLGCFSTEQCLISTGDSLKTGLCTAASVISGLTARSAFAEWNDFFRLTAVSTISIAVFFLGVWILQCDAVRLLRGFFQKPDTMPS